MSYQLTTFTKLLSEPLTLVDRASKMLLAGLPMTSLLTIGSSQYSRIPLSLPLAAAWMASLTVSALTD